MKQKHLGKVVAISAISAAAVLAILNIPPDDIPLWVGVAAKNLACFSVLFVGFFCGIASCPLWTK